MNLSSISILLVSLLAASCASTRPSFSVDMPVASKYVFRGAVLDDNAVLQPELRAEQEVGSGVIGAALWSNFELGDDRGYEGNFTEYDVTVDYSTTLGRIDLSVGAARYEYPHTEFAGSTELFAMFSVNELWVTPTFEVWYDSDEIEGFYFNFNLSRDFELAPEWTLSTVAGVGWMDKENSAAYFGGTDSGFSDALAQVALAHPLSEQVTVTAVASFASVLDSEFRDGTEDPDNAVFGIGISFGF